ncbi:hypothetical protein BEP19_01125 [Ammoniphilus oxalaticus]|uniref:Stage III sporulation protein AH n=1 Tax=Ammoniphilus oxalaticus TaxID=66863 RepID=A0A419SMP5_9BACL|nr:SpoIIIAH-like family protein [Ammoniphilus oxalaticus]RKD25576.1 hypothetical protein BEP19_01125 [Ammoniphilus oxalaticus]
MVLKKQTVWLLSMLTIMVVLSAYYLAQGPVEQVPVASEVTEDEAKTKAEAEVDSKQVMEQPEQVDGNVEVVSEKNADYFAEVKMNREAWNSQTLEKYMDVWANSDASAEAIAEAKQSYDVLLGKQDAELNVENLIKALGYEEAVIVTNEDRVSVVVQADKLERKQAVEIVSLINKHLEVPSKNIVVSFKP